MGKIRLQSYSNTYLYDEIDYRIPTVFLLPFSNANFSILAGSCDFLERPDLIVIIKILRWPLD